MPPVNNTLGFQNFLSGKLTADVTAGATDIFIDTVPSITQGFIVIDPLTPASREIIFFTSKTATKVSVPATGGRGVDGTSAVPHFNGTTYIIAPIAAMFTALQNGSASTDPIRTAIFFDFIQSGGVVAQSALLVGTFSNIIFWQNGVQYTGTSIANKTYTVSKDTYVDVLGNSDGTITIQYNEVANNATSPALSSGYTRVAIVTTNGTTITNVNQGQETMVIPLISSVPICVNDSLGNLINPRDPLRRVLGVRRRVTSDTTGTATVGQITELSCPIIVPAGRKYIAKLNVTQILNDTSGQYAETSIWEGVVGSGVELAAASQRNSTASADGNGNCETAPRTPASSTVTVNGAKRNPGAVGIAQFVATLGAGVPISLVVTLA